MLAIAQMRRPYAFSLVYQIEARIAMKDGPDATLSGIIDLDYREGSRRKHAATPHRSQSSLTQTDRFAVSFSHKWLVQFRVEDRSV